MGAVYFIDRAAPRAWWAMGGFLLQGLLPATVIRVWAGSQQWGIRAASPDGYDLAARTDVILELVPRIRNRLIYST
ncbi:hypothetical protein DXM27_04840 [Rhizobium rhizogenes]|uniref:Uncharacterized protein n=1 Tax=Rhizobium rhizogenes TaxID=359 RepID=A0AA88JRR9_RHIRH|nr:hypothetical protein [Rhizobium rhizogenes]KAA3504546.1 hypothetical protein DXM27_04840 [Rhizobium rhizogenes]